ncbi:MAG TPA: hypothetical protein QF772_00425 [Nitrospinaceae bacterium]|nr:hypothetical protein [Gammaproteobacteria bacterium]HJO56673.1 hypothetical protein [Nitrospinaceae bacterium]
MIHHLGPWIALTTLTLSGFDPTPGAQNSPEQVLSVHLLFSFAVPAFYTLAAMLAYNYPITAERHARLRETLERRQARKFQI